jgi:hypothetical protein
MSDQSEDDSIGSDTGDGAADAFDPLFGEIEEVRYFVTDEDEPYTVVIENVNEVRLTVIYELTPDRGVAWIFRSVDAAMWGDAMWANNEDVVDVAESAREAERAVLVTEECARCRVLKLLTFDEELEEWQVFLVLHAGLSSEEGTSSRSGSVGSASFLSDPSLSVESASD